MQWYTTIMQASSRVLLAGGFAAMLLPGFANAASISIDTGADAYGLGDTFVATVRIDNEDECINAVQVEADYPVDTLRAVDFSRGGSIMSLWVSDPQIDTDKGVVTFSGGIPGGYCGHIQGDASPSDTLGKIVFTVVGAQKDSATINLGLGSRVYLHDGQGTPASLSLHSKTLAIGSAATMPENPWLKEVGDDTTAPEAFTAQVESTKGIFGGKYYVVFSTTDKQSGLDHYEILENGAWRRVTSPYVLQDQSLDGGVKLRAIDKAGNMRLADFDPSSVPPRQYSFNEFLSLAILAAIALIAIVLRMFFIRRNPPAGVQH